jgi:exonuclease VII small subunit
MREKQYEITKQIEKLEIEDLIEILEDLNSKLNSNELNLEESIKIFEFAKKIQKLAFKKLNEIEFKFSEIMIDEE